MPNQRLIDLFCDLVKIDSETTNELPVAQFVEPLLNALGFSVQYDNANQQFPSNTGNLIAKRGDTKQADTIVLSAHMDTVKPGIGVEPVVLEDRIVSAGDTILGSDDKAGIAAIIEGIRLADEQSVVTRPIEIVFCIAEEGGLNGSKYLDYQLIDGRACYVLDTGGSPGVIINQAPAQDQIEVTIRGKAAHAGVSPEKGVSAIQIASSAISNMQLLRIDAETTANIGVINGGLATNIVCPEVKLRAEARSRDEAKLVRQTEHMVDCFNQAADAYNATVQIDVTRAYNTFHVADDHEVLGQVKAAMQRLGLTPQVGPAGGGSDANNFNHNGLTAVILGIGMTNVHTVDEYILLDDLTMSAQLVSELVRA